MVGGYNRRVSFKKAKRRKRISHYHYYFYLGFYASGERFDNLHQYSKNQIYCSCPMCTKKTNNKRRDRYSPVRNWKHSDLKRVTAMDDEQKEFEQEDG